jgi:hypothetical protein
MLEMKLATYLKIIFKRKYEMINSNNQQAAAFVSLPGLRSGVRT